MSEADVVNSQTGFGRTFLPAIVCQDLRIVGGIYGVATPSGTKRRFKPKRRGRVDKNLINAGQVACCRAVAHPKLVTPLRSQLHRRLRSARRLHQERWNPPSGPGQSAWVRANDNDGSRGSTRQM